MATKPLNFEEARELAQLALGHQKKFVEKKYQAFLDMFGSSNASKTPADEWYYKKVTVAVLIQLLYTLLCYIGQFLDEAL